MHLRSVLGRRLAWLTNDSALFAPVAYTVDSQTGAGWLGLISYSLFIGLPLIMIAWMGGTIRSKFPHVLSLGQYARERFGPGVELFVTTLVFINLAVGLLLI